MITPSSEIKKYPIMSSEVSEIPEVYGCSKHSRRFAGLEACFLLVTVVFRQIRTKAPP